MGILAINALSLTVSSLTVNLQIYPEGFYVSAYCTAFPEGHPTPYPLPQDTAWFVEDEISGNFTGIRFLPMPVIDNDFTGTPLQPGTTYILHCVSYDNFRGTLKEEFLDFKFTTVNKMCSSGVSVTDISTGIKTPLLPTKTITDSVLDLGHTKYYQFPHNIHGLNVFEFPRPFAGNSEIEVKCCEGEECVFWLSLYQCTHCTGEKPQGLGHELVTKGWDGGVCSPKFDDGFSTVAYHKLLDANHGDVYEYLYSQYDEIAVMFGIEGAVPDPWCYKSHGPSSPGANCGARCPHGVSP
eukprot:TRINITY_DN11289_c0_g1_i1.p1 TRINITY_DN11289_c0_g1~~TRINITY_DN11289_c0_g1_i1.p1  ORF type:complete len:296 (+),score=42.94 TRINITY_DN11289_c0_g1_i1:92-979(+)